MYFIFSLNNISMTCVRLRQICSSLLDAKGCVCIHWERRKSDFNGFQWHCDSKHWFFSTAMHPIDSWILDNVGEVSEHLKICPYNIKCDHKNAIRRTTQWNIVTEQIRQFNIIQGLKKTMV